MNDTGPGSGAAAAADLYRQLREADLARDADPDPAQRRAAGELLNTADKVTRLAARQTDVCPMPWRTCAEHGATLRSTARRCWVHHPGCLRQGHHDRLSEPCAEPVTHRVIDADGDQLNLCDGHATDARTRIIGATVIPLS